MTDQYQSMQQYQPDETPSPSKTGQDGDMWTHFDKLMGRVLDVFAGVGFVFFVIATLLIAGVL